MTRPPRDLTGDAPTSDVADRLGDLLTRSADAVDLHPDLDAVLDAPTLISLIDVEDRRVDPRRRRHPARRLALGAVAAAAIIALVGTALAIRGNDPDQPVASEGGIATEAVPTAHAERFPVVDEWPDPDFEPVSASVHDVGDGVQPGPSVVFGHRDRGTIVDAVVVRSYHGTPAPYELAESLSVTIGDHEAYAIPTAGHAGEDAGRLVVVEDGETTLVAAGPGALDLLQAHPDLVRLRSGEDGLELEVGELPAGLEVVAGPTTPSSQRMWPSLLSAALDTGNPPHQVFVESRPGDPLAAVAWAGVARPTEVGGRSGWIVENDGATYLAWDTGEGSHVVVSGAIDAATARAVAAEVRMVDQATWEGTYGVDVDDATSDATTDTTTDTTAPATTAPTTDGTDPASAWPDSAAGEWVEDHPLLGQPLPDLPADGEGAPHPIDGWGVVVVGAPWCVPCVRMVGDEGWGSLDGFDDLDLILVAVESPRDEVAAWLGDDDLWSWRVADAASEWGAFTSVPTVLVVDPDGIVRAVADGAVTPGDALARYVAVRTELAAGDDPEAGGDDAPTTAATAGAAQTTNP